MAEKKNTKRLVISPTRSIAEPLNFTLYNPNLATYHHLHSAIAATSP